MKHCTPPQGLAADVTSWNKDLAGIKRLWLLGKVLMSGNMIAAVLKFLENVEPSILLLGVIVCVCKTSYRFVKRT